MRASLQTSSFFKTSLRFFDIGPVKKIHFHFHLDFWTCLPPEKIEAMRLKLARSELIDSPQGNVQRIADSYKLNDQKSIEELELESRTRCNGEESVDAAARRAGMPTFQ